MSQEPPFLMRSTNILQILALIGFVAGLAVIITKYPSLPETIPIHFDIQGKADNFALKHWLWSAPVVSAALYALLTVVSQFPQITNYPVAITSENAPRQYELMQLFMGLLKTELVWIFAFIQWQVVRAASLPGFPFNSFVVLSPVVVIFATVGWYIWRAYQLR
jgi:uncharacterized membrane protein